MRRLKWTTLVLGCLVAARTGFAQEAIQAPKGAAPGEVVGVGHCPPNAPHCAPACPPTEKVCVPVPDKLKITTVIYGCKEKDFCLPHCNCKPSFHWLRKCCGDSCHEPACPLGKCEHHARTKTVLLKKVIVEECDSYKCVVEERLKECGPRCKTHGGACQVVVPANNTTPVHAAPIQTMPTAVAPRTPNPPLNVVPVSAPAAISVAPLP